MIDTFFKVALAQGGPYLVCAFLLAGLVFCFKGWKEEAKGRLDDARTTIPLLESVKKGMDAITGEMASRTSMSASFGEMLRNLNAGQDRTNERLEKLNDMLRDGNRRGQS